VLRLIMNRFTTKFLKLLFLVGAACLCLWLLANHPVRMVVKAWLLFVQSSSFVRWVLPRRLEWTTILVLLLCTLAWDVVGGLNVLYLFLILVVVNLMRIFVMRYFVPAIDPDCVPSFVGVVANVRAAVGRAGIGV
jgi:hypothetical protein